jgi:transposase
LPAQLSLKLSGRLIFFAGKFPSCVERARQVVLERKRVAKALIDGGASERKAAKALGVGRSTVRHDLGRTKRPAGPKGPKSGPKRPTAKSAEDEDAAARDEHSKTTFLHRADLASSSLVSS